MPVKMSPPLLALGALLLLATSASALDLGGVGVGVSVGGDGGVGLDLGVGDADVSVGLGGDGGGLGIDLDVDLDGDGVPESSSGGQGIQPLGQEGALRAVQSNRALPLADILTRARLVAEGEIIDAQLIQVRRILVYAIKVLGKSGDVRELYFYARSGALVTPE